MAVGEGTMVDEGLEQPVDGDDLFAGDVLGEVDDVRTDVAQGARAGLVLLEPPGHRRRRVREPVLEVLRAYVPDLADPSLLHQLTRQRYGRHPR